jgi:Uma2 family endonuclease
MSEVINFKDEEFDEGVGRDMPSKKHSMAQTNLTGLLYNDERFIIFVELSLDASSIDLRQFDLKNKDEVIPDISVYLEPPPDQDDGLGDDEVRVSKMPDLAIEVLSPTQAINTLLKKIKVYFAFGVKACWLVIPSLEEVRVFSQPGSYKIFDTQRDTEVIDEVMDIHLSIHKVFKMRSVISDQ